MDYELIKPDAQDKYDSASFLNYARARRTDKEERDAVIGDSVHLWDAEACRAAIVTDDPELDSVWLSFLMPGETSWRPVKDVRHDETKGEMTWHWPCGGH